MMQKNSKRKTFDYQYWTVEQLDYLRINADKMPARHFAERFNRSIPSVRQRAYELKISLCMGFEGDDVPLVNFNDVERLAFCLPWV